MKKDQMLAHWKTIEPQQKIAIKPVAYKHEGSTYDEDGIRITGSQKFIDSVLSRLTDLLDYEGDETRLQVVYKESTDRHTGAQLDSFNCYIQVHYRGDEARRVNRYVARCRTKHTEPRFGNFPTAIMQINHPIHNGQPNSEHGRFFFVGSIPIDCYDQVKNTSKHYDTEEEAIQAAINAGAKRIQRKDCSFVEIPQERMTA